MTFSGIVVGKDSILVLWHEYEVGEVVQRLAGESFGIRRLRDNRDLSSNRNIVELCKCSESIEDRILVRIFIYFSNLHNRTGTVGKL